MPALIMHHQRNSYTKKAAKKKNGAKKIKHNIILDSGQEAEVSVARGRSLRGVRLGCVFKFRGNGHKRQQINIKCAHPRRLRTAQARMAATWLLPRSRAGDLPRSRCGGLRLGCILKFCGNGHRRRQINIKCAHPEAPANYAGKDGRYMASAKISCWRPSAKPLVDAKCAQGRPYETVAAVCATGGAFGSCPWRCVGAFLRRRIGAAL
jgi:hypothetical protein